MRKSIFSLLLLSMLLYSCGTTKYMSDADAEAQIKAVMKMQEKAWSDGNIDQFMEGYLKSENLSFIGSKGVTKGWDTTKENYKRGYPDKTAMGKLTFKILELNRISGEAYHMIGRYTLKREIDEPTGIFSLIWKHVDGKWLIVADHTS